MAKKPEVAPKRPYVTPIKAQMALEILRSTHPSHTIYSPSISTSSQYQGFPVTEHRRPEIIREPASDLHKAANQALLDYLAQS